MNLLFIELLSFHSGAQFTDSEDGHLFSILKLSFIEENVSLVTAIEALADKYECHLLTDHSSKKILQLH